MFFKMVPRYLAKGEDGQHLDLEEVETALWAVLIHDIGWLKNSADEIDYNSSAEKFFVHCEQGQYLAWKILPILSQKRIVGQRLKQAVEVIQYTEFNFFEAQAQPNPLGELVRAIDNYFVYACQPNHMPEGVMALYYEHQAMANPEGPATQKYFYDNLEKKDKKGKTLKTRIAQSLGINEDKAEDWFNQGLLTIADLKFPGQSVVDFVASSYMSYMSDMYNQCLYNHLKETSGGYLDFQDEQILQRNLKLAARRIYLRHSQVNHLAYLEAEFTGLEVKRWEKKLCDQGILENEVLNRNTWQTAHARMLGWGEYKHESLFERLVTPEIKKIFQAVADKQTALKLLLEDYVRKNRYSSYEFKKIKKDEIHLAIAPQAYEGLDLEEILSAFSKVNKQNEQNVDLPKLKPIITVRRDQAEDLGMDKDGFLTQIKSLAHDYDFEVVLAGKEDCPLADFKKQLEFLAGDDQLSVLIQAGQIIGKDDPERLGAENLSWAVEFAQQHNQVVLVGLQYGKEKINPVTRGKIEALTQSGRVIATFLSDQQTLFKDKPLEAHPLFGFWQEVLYATPHGFIPNNVFLEKLLLEKRHALV